MKGRHWPWSTREGGSGELRGEVVTLTWVGNVEIASCEAEVIGDDPVGSRNVGKVEIGAGWTLAHGEVACYRQPA